MLLDLDMDFCKAQPVKSFPLMSFPLGLWGERRFRGLRDEPPSPVIKLQVFRITQVPILSRILAAPCLQCTANVASCYSWRAASSFLQWDMETKHYGMLDQFRAAFHTRVALLYQHQTIYWRFCCRSQLQLQHYCWGVCRVDATRVADTKGDIGPQLRMVVS